MSSSLEHGQVQTWLDHHAHQLLHEQLGGVGHVDPANVLSRTASLAVILGLLHIGLAEHSAG